MLGLRKAWKVLLCEWLRDSLRPFRLTPGLARPNSKPGLDATLYSHWKGSAALLPKDYKGTYICAPTPSRGEAGVPSTSARAGGGRFWREAERGKGWKASCSAPFRLPAHRCGGAVTGALHGVGGIHSYISLATRAFSFSLDTLNNGLCLVSREIDEGQKKPRQRWWYDSSGTSLSGRLRTCCQGVKVVATEGTQPRALGSMGKASLLL